MATSSEFEHVLTSRGRLQRKNYTCLELEFGSVQLSKGGIMFNVP